MPFVTALRVGGPTHTARCLPFGIGGRPSGAEGRSQGPPPIEPVCVGAPGAEQPGASPPRRRGRPFAPFAIGAPSRWRPEDGLRCPRRQRRFRRRPATNPTPAGGGWGTATTKDTKCALSCVKDGSSDGRKIRAVTPTPRCGPHAIPIPVVCCVRCNQTKGRLTHGEFHQLLDFLETCPPASRLDVLARLGAGVRGCGQGQYPQPMALVEVGK
jgi:hypothetical protein